MIKYKKEIIQPLIKIFILILIQNILIQIQMDLI